MSNQINYFTSISLIILYFFGFPQIHLFGGELWRQSLANKRADRIFDRNHLKVELKEPFGAIVSCEKQQACKDLRQLDEETYAWLKLLAFENGHVVLKGFDALEPKEMENAARFIYLETIESFIISFFIFFFNTKYCI